jgi:hypothetical protein
MECGPQSKSFDCSSQPITEYLQTLRSSTEAGGVGRCSEKKDARARPTSCPAERPGYESKTRTIRLPGSATARVQCAVVWQQKATFGHLAMRLSNRLVSEAGHSSGGPDRYP